MAITVKLVGALRHFSGAGELELGCSGCASVGDLVDALVKKVPEIERSLIDRQLEDPRPNSLILVNGREIGVLDGLETKLKDGDEVVLVPVVHGG
jgi:molybdopterin synthase sulfur carrier subunit